MAAAYPHETLDDEQRTMHAPSHEHLNFSTSKLLYHVFIHALCTLLHHQTLHSIHYNFICLTCCQRGWVMSCGGEGAPLATSVPTRELGIEL